MLKLQADYMASAMWDSYCKATEPDRRRHYALRYEFWASLRDKDTFDPHKDCTHDKEPTKGGA